MIEFNRDYTLKEIEQIEMEKELEQEEYIRKQFTNYENGNDKGKKSTNKNKENEEDDIKNDYPINKYSQGIPLAESILVNNVSYFIQIIDGKPIYTQKIELSDINIVPLERTEYLSKEYSFNSFEEVQYFVELAKLETLDSLKIKVKIILKKYIDIDDDFINILTADIIFTYFQDRLKMTHYLLIVGDNNTGKSNILLVFSFLGYRPILDTAITPANIYNFGGYLEDGQCIILEDEIDDIDDQSDKKKYYKSSYRAGVKVTRMYDNNNSTPVKSKRKSSRQNGFFLFGFKMFASEKMPDKIKSKGFLERIIPLKAVPGHPEYDISEVVDESGDEQFKELYGELMDTRKLLLMYRLLHYNDPIPNINLNIKNRYKQLTKPVIRLFQNTESVNEITSSLSKYLIEKNQEKIDSIDSAILLFIVNLVSKQGEILYNDHIWNELRLKYPNGEIQDKPYSWYMEGYGIVSKNGITKTCETKFGAKPYRDSEKGRGLIFNQKTLNKLVVNYSIIEEIKIIKKEEEEEKKKNEDSPQNPNDTYVKNDTFTECIKQNNQYNSLVYSTNSLDLRSNDKKKIQEKRDSKLKTDENNVKKINTHSREMSYLSYPSPQSQDNLIKLKSLQHSIFSKIKTGLFINPLISESDLLLANDNYDYDPNIINNIYRFEGTDRWFCNNCTIKGDKWFMMKHPCKNTNKS
jgi:hypothetical protein